MPAMYRLALDAAAEGSGASGQDCAPEGQLAHFVKGVGLEREDDFVDGSGTWKRALQAYEWLSERYTGRNSIFVFGASRGGLSARMLQGMIHKYGLAKPGYAKEVTSVSPFHWCEVDSKQFRTNPEKSWGGARIAHMGLMETVLRSLNSLVEHWSIKQLGMRMTSTVEAASVALALDDPRMLIESHELAMDEATDAQQVWFGGQHRDVMGGFPTTGLSRIAAGWMLDRAEASGLLLPKGWRQREGMRADCMEYAGHMAGLGPGSHVFIAPLTLELNLGWAKVKDPNECQEKGRRVLIHKSVEDRMSRNPGFVPQPFCCRGTEDGKGGYDLDNIEYVSSPHYDYWRNEPSDSAGNPAWFKLSFGRLSGMHQPGTKGFFLRVTSWSDKAIETGRVRDYGGHASVVVHRSGNARHEDGHQDFSDRPLVFPRLYAATRFIVEVAQEPQCFGTGYIGRVEIRLDGDAVPTPAGPDGDAGGELGTYDVLAEPATGDDQGAKVGSLQAKVETIATDEDAAKAMGGRGEAHCQWLLTASGLSWGQLCHNSAAPIFGLRRKGATCQDFVREITTGNNSQDLTKEDWHEERDAPETE